MRLEGGNVPVILRRLNQIIDLRIDHLENPLLSSLLIAPKLFRGIKHYWTSG